MRLVFSEALICRDSVEFDLDECACGDERLDVKGCVGRAVAEEDVVVRGRRLASRRPVRERCAF
jgi:hypothetical protein